MDGDRARKIVGTAMVGLGVLQAGLGVVSEDTLFAGFGITYALIGALYLWGEVYRAG